MAKAPTASASASAAAAAGVFSSDDSELSSNETLESDIEEEDTNGIHKTTTATTLLDSKANSKPASDSEEQEDELEEDDEEQVDELVESDNSEADDQDFLEDDDDDNEEEEVYAAKPSTSRSSGQTSSSFYSAAAKKASAASSSTYKSSTLSANATNKPTTIKLNLKGGKIIHYENVTIPMGDKSIIDKFLSWQVNPETDQEEILIKYKNMSFYHAEWVSRDLLELDKPTKNRIKKFMDKGYFEGHWTEDEPFNPAFVKIDRIIDEGELGDQVYFLVKWCSQTYDLSTWETQETVKKIDPEKIGEFHLRRVLDDKKVVSYELGSKRPGESAFRTIKESPEFKNGNQLRSYQLEGLNWLLYCYHRRQNSILADEMGLGKTIQSTSFLNHLHTKLNIQGPFLIVTPLSTIGNWEREIKTWTNMNVVVYHGRDTSRHLIVDTEFYYKGRDGKSIPGIYKFDIVLTTYEMAMSGLAQLKPVHWRCVVLDEAHKLKNKTSKISETMKLYKMDHRVLLTGTPLQNSLEELWALLNFLEPEKFADEKYFQAMYGSMTTATDVERLQAVLKPLMLRRLKEDVETSIPLKEETIIEVELTVMQKKWYKSILERNFSWLKQGAKSKNMPNLINTMMELRKCCIHPFLLKGAEDRIYEEFSADTADKHLLALIQASGKMVLIDKLLKKLHAGGHKVLIFSQMTKCLDLIQDYLRQRNYGFERIDGSVRGDVRQGAIDRFCSPNSESFVFLLCTRAGGVGINLTVADTVIIFDSDWNPQNDLQAQSRCHRIGQTKSVQIYRLITRNTYERDMFDRASMKLGLDKAVLQRMDNSSANADDPFSEYNKTASALSKQEVEALLKKGAYGAFLDDEASKNFCEEDIEDILLRRTRVIRHDNPEEKGSIFSKASFASANTDALDMDDPDFWDKVAEKAELMIEDPIAVNDLMYEPRQRRQVQRFGNNEDEEPPSEDEGGGDVFGTALAVKKEVPLPAVKQKKPQLPPAPKLWSVTERSRLERMLMLWGYSDWEIISEAFPRRTIQDLKAATKQLITRCLRAPGLETDLVADIKALVEVDASREGDQILGFKLDEVSNETPFPDATEKQIAEYRSFLTESPADYSEHVDKKAKTLLNRLQMLYLLKEKIRPDQSLEIPKVLGNNINKWWSAEDDRDLLIGVVKHGYGQYIKMREDPDLGFHKRKYINVVPISAADASASTTLNIDEDGAGGNEDGENASIGDLAEDAAAKLEDKDKLIDIDNESVTESKDVINNVTEEKNAVDDDASSTREVDEGEVDALAVSSSTEVKVDENIQETFAENPLETAASDEPDSANQQTDFSADDGVFAWPTASELGVRARRVVAVFQRKMKSEAVKLAKLLEKEKEKEKKTKPAKDKATVAQERLKQKERELNRKDRNEFRKLLISYGVETSVENRQVNVWDRFRELSGIQKPDDVLDTYFLKLLSMSNECVELADELVEESKKKITSGDPNAAIFNPMLLKIDRQGDSITYDVAKRIIKRVESMKKLREVVLVNPDMEQYVGRVKRPPRSGLPLWWNTEYDVAFLKGISKWGIIRTENMLKDQSLPFYQLHQDYLKLKGIAGGSTSSAAAAAAGDDGATDMDLDGSTSSSVANSVPPQTQPQPPQPPSVSTDTSAGGGDNSYTSLMSTVDPSIEGGTGDAFWMKETIAIRRFESLCEAVIKPIVRRRSVKAAGGGGVGIGKTPIDSEDEGEYSTSTGKRHRQFLEEGASKPDSSSSSPPKPKPKKRRKKAKKELDSDEDMDGMMEQVVYRLEGEKRKRKANHSLEMLDDTGLHAVAQPKKSSHVKLSSASLISDADESAAFNTADLDQDVDMLNTKHRKLVHSESYDSLANTVGESEYEDGGAGSFGVGLAASGMSSASSSTSALNVVHPKVKLILSSSSSSTSSLSANAAGVNIPLSELAPLPPPPPVAPTINSNEGDDVSALPPPPPSNPHVHPPRSPKL